MNGTGRHSENSGYLVILLLVVALTAFSYSMKELTEIHQLTLDASSLVARWSGNFTPAETPVTVVKVETCEASKQSAPVVELPWLNRTPAPQTVPSMNAPIVPRQAKAPRTEPRVVSPILSEAEIAKLRKLQRINVDADEFEVRIPSAPFPVVVEQGSTPDMPEFTFKTKTHKPAAIRMNPRDREMFLKTLNRSINLRIAS